MNTLKDYLEILYYLSMFVLVIITALGLNQIRILKRDIKTRNERASKEKAIEYCSEYLLEFISLINNYYRDLIKSKLPVYNGEVGDFSYLSIKSSELENSEKRFSIDSWLPAFNKLESIAAVFISGVADECTAFKIIGRNYCAVIESYYDIIVICRIHKINPYWFNIVELYEIWSSRLKKAELKIEKEAIDNTFQSVEDKMIKPIGIE